MKSFTFAILLFIELISNKDIMMFGSLKPLEVKESILTLDRGSSNVSVFTTSDTLISCQFIDSNGALTLEQNKVKRCAGSAEVDSTTKITLKVHNEENKMVDYRIHLVGQAK